LKYNVSLYRRERRQEVGGGGEAYVFEEKLWCSYLEFVCGGEMGSNQKFPCGRGMDVFWSNTILMPTSNHSMCNTPTTRK